MPVLSERPSQHFSYSNLQIRVDLWRIEGRLVRIESNALEEIGALSEALANDDERPTRSLESRQLRHRSRNHLNVVSVAWQLAQMQFEAGLADDASNTLDRLLDELRQLDRLMDETASTGLAIGAYRPAHAR